MHAVFKTLEQWIKMLLCKLDMFSGPPDDFMSSVSFDVVQGQLQLITVTGACANVIIPSINRSFVYKAKEGRYVRIINNSKDVER
jgi:hypothetical protein